MTTQMAALAEQAQERAERNAKQLKDAVATIRAAYWEAVAARVNVPGSEAQPSGAEAVLGRFFERWPLEGP